MAEKEKIAIPAAPGKVPAAHDISERSGKYGPATLVVDQSDAALDLAALAKPEDRELREQSLLGLQRARGNYYVQSAIAEYQRTHPTIKKEPSPAAGVKPATAAVVPSAGAGDVSAPGAPPGRASETSTGDLTAKLGAKVGGAVGSPTTTAALPTKAAGVPSPTASNKELAQGTSLEAWKAGVHTATRRLKTDKITAGPQIANVQQSAAKLSAKQHAETKKLPKDGKGAVTPPPKVNTPQPLVPPKVDPVPEATKVVEDASNKALPAQTMPALEQSPQGNMPQIRPAPSPAPPGTATDTQAKAPDAQAKAAQETEAVNPAKEQVDKVNAPPEKKPEGPFHKGPGGEIVIEDKAGPPPPEPSLPPVFKGGIAAALARLMADPKAEAESILSQVRSTAYGGQLQVQFPDIGKSSLDELTTSLSTELDGIRKEAGISEQEIKDAVDKRQKEIQKEKEEAQGQLNSAASNEKEKVGQVGTDALSVIAGTRQEIDQATEDKLAQTKGDNDPEVVKLRRDRLIRESQKRVAAQVVLYDQAGKKRHSEITQVAELQRVAYRNAVKLDEQELNQLAGGDASRAWPWQMTLANSRNWGDSQSRKIDQLLVDKGKETDGFVLGLQEAVRDAGQQANEMVRTWADVKLNQHRGFFEKLWQMFSDWASQAKADSEAWETSRNKATRDAMAADMNFLGGVVMTAGDQLSEESLKNLDKLSAEQRAIVMTYYGIGPDGKPVVGAKDAKNPFAAIAAGLRVRILQQRGPKILEQFEDELIKTPAAQWDKLDALGKGQDPNFDAAKVCSEVHEALHGGLVGWNDEPRVFRALAGRTKIQATAARKLYSLPSSQGGYGKDLDEDIHSELGGAERTRAEALLAGDQTLADVATLREAMHGGITGWGTDEKAIMDTLRKKSAAERDKIKQLYFEKYGVKLEDDIKEELTGVFEDEHDYDRAQALMQGDTNKADAIAIDQAMYGGLTGWGTDRKAIEDVYSQVRQDTEKELQEEARRTGKTLTTKELEAAVKRRYEQLEASYNTTYKDKWGEGDESALRRAYKDELSDGELALVNAIADNDLTKADAARIQVEKESVFYADDDIINGVLKHQYERALEELKRDKGPALYKKLEEDRIKNHWDIYRYKQEQHKIDRQLEEEAKNKGKQYMAQLEDTYDTDFGSIGKGSLRNEIEKNMSGYELQEARKRVAQGGWLTPAQEIHFATEGLGTKEEMLTKALEGKTADEIKEIEKEWQKLHPGESLKERIDSETSGRLNFELSQKLKGEPMSMKEEKERMDELVQHEREHGSIVFATDEQKRMEFRYKEMKKKYDAANDPNLTDDQRAQKIADFQRFAGYTKVSVDEHKESMESITNSLVTAVTTAIAVVVAAVCIIFSGGTATPGVVAAFAAWASSAAGAATIALGTAVIGVGIREAMLGSDYGIEDMGTDLAIGGVDAAAAAATAGLSKVVMSSAAERFVESLGKNLTVAERQALITTLEQDPKFAKGLLGTMAQSSSRPTRMFAHAASGAMFGALGAAPSGAARSILDSKTWEGGGAWEKILEGTTSAMKQGAAGGAVMGMAGGIRAPHAPGKVPVYGEGDVRPLAERDILPPGQKHTPDTLKEGLPPDLQKKVPIAVDPELEGNTVRVHYGVDENGVLKDIHIRAGPNATPRDIELHVRTVRTMQKYSGLQGRVRALIAKARAWVSRQGPLPKRAFEAQLEVEKLPSIIEEHVAKLADPELDPKVRAELEADVQHLQDQLSHNQGILEGAMPMEEARGYVAAEARKKGVTGVAEAEEEVVSGKPKKTGVAPEGRAKAPAAEKGMKAPTGAVKRAGVAVEEEMPRPGAEERSRTEAHKELADVRRRIEELTEEPRKLRDKLDRGEQLSADEVRRLQAAKDEIEKLRLQGDELADRLGEKQVSPEPVGELEEGILTEKEIIRGSLSELEGAQLLRPMVSSQESFAVAKEAGITDLLTGDSWVFTRADFPEVLPEEPFGFGRAAPAQRTPVTRFERGFAVEGRPVSRSEIQNLDMLEDYDLLIKHGADPASIRINQRMVIEDVTAGTNRPDLYAELKGGQRIHIEYDRAPGTRSMGHALRILSNDPDAIVILKIIDF